VAARWLSAADRHRAPAPRVVSDSNDIDAHGIRRRHHRTLFLVDARAPARYRGEQEPIDPVAGHIPGARCIPFEGNLDRSNRFAAPEVLRSRFAADRVADRELVCYCGSGVSACHNILAMRIAGLPEPALYPGSFSEWIQDPDHPVER
jgi:thiosulfate/3-mercaptopyruvate sulfurtransferase